MCLHVTAGPLPAGHLHLAVEISHLLFEIDNSTLYFSFLEDCMLAATMYHWYLILPLVVGGHNGKDPLLIY